MDLPMRKGDKSFHQSVSDSSNDGAIAGIEGKVKADEDRKAKKGISPNFKTGAARVVTETYAQVRKKLRGGHQSKQQDEVKRA